MAKQGHRTRYWQTLFIALSLVLLSSCDRLLPEAVKSVVTALPAPGKDQDLVVLIRNGATSFYVDAESRYAGPEYDLVRNFAEQQGWRIKFVVMPDQAEAAKQLSKGQAHLAVGMTRQRDSGVHYGPQYEQMQPVLVMRDDRPAPEKITDIRSKIWAAPQLMPAMDSIKAQLGTVHWTADNDYDDEALIERVSSGIVDYAVVDQRAADAAQNFYPDVAIAMTLGNPLPAVWAWNGRYDPVFGTQVASYFQTIKKNGSLTRAFNRYYGYSARLDAEDATEFLSKRVSVLPKLMPLFAEAEASYGIDWRLLASLAYQESHWDRMAVSPFGVRGIMMLTTETADRLGVSNRLDARDSILGGAKYLSLLKADLPDHIVDPDRTWLALAAYNIGIAHLEDARILAQRQHKNPNLWTDIRDVLPLLQDPEQSSSLRFGYARGGEARVFVENLRSYFDILVRFESPVKPIFPPFDQKVTVVNPSGLRLGIDESHRH